MKHGSLFSGIGGFDLAAEWMGWENSFHCEWNEFGQRVLKHYWPKAKSYEDITKVDFRPHRGNIDILTGGFPCQPFSAAGKRKGTDDSRHLWPEMCRAIREIEPTYVVGENVRGLLNWNEGLVFDQVCADLETCGYEVQPFLLPAAGVNAPHRRDRIWFVAYSNHNGESRRSKGNEEKSEGKRVLQRNKIQLSNESNSLRGFSPDSNSRGLERSKEKGRNSLDVKRKGESWNAPDTDNELCQSWNESIQKGWQDKGERTKPLGNNKQRREQSDWQNFPTQSPICGGDDGLPTELDGVTFPKWRNESIKAYGNAIVPQVAYQIFKALELNEAQN
jgi:DNA (cytosine-5)-methyltransferase 1